MPMDFPDMKSLIMAAKVFKFRSILDNESEDEYREALADHVQEINFIDSSEIRYKVGWDKWDEQQNRDHLRRRLHG